MGYQALLFCPEEKTARTVTQVLSELEFTVEASAEPFAAVKKLMGQHFDAVVVDCDNEQNATLLFKSARNSTSNQASLAVAVVEGQAGVAKAFRIGANLVLTKPINVEQAKGTLRVARGLLRKGEPAKPAAPGATPAGSSAPAKTAPAPPVAAKPASPAAPAARPAAAVPAKPAAAAAWPAQTAAASLSARAQGTEGIHKEEKAAASAAASTSKKVSAAPSVKAPASPTISSAAAEKPAPAAKAGVTAFGSGAASAPAPAREVSREVPQVPIVESAPAAKDASADRPAEAQSSGSGSFAAPAPAPSFSLSTDVTAEANVDRKKIFLGIAAVVLVVAGIVTAWQLLGRKPQAVSTTPAATTPAATAPAPAPASAQPAPTTTTPSASASQPASQPVAAAAKPSAATDDAESAPENTRSSAPSSAKPTSSASADSSKPAAAAKPEPAPMVVKGGAQPKVAKASAPDAPAAPSMIGIATPGSGGSLPNIVDNTGNAPKPILQALNVSQGVSQGLLMKKVQPVYPRTALTMHVEGTVQLMATIAKSGDITAIKVLSGPPQLTSAATDAVKQWKYKPYLLNGEPVEIQTQVTVVFRLPR